MLNALKMATARAKIEISAIVEKSAIVAEIIAAVADGKTVKILTAPELLCTSCKLSIPTTAAANNAEPVVCARCRENKHLGDTIAGIRRDRDAARAKQREAAEACRDFVHLAHSVLDRAGGGIPNIPSELASVAILRDAIDAARDLRHRVTRAEHVAREIQAAPAYVDAIARHLGVSLEHVSRDPVVMLAAVCTAIGAPLGVTTSALRLPSEPDRDAGSYDVPAWKATWEIQADPRQMTIDALTISPAPPPTGERTTAGAELSPPSHVPPVTEGAAPAVSRVRKRAPRRS